MDKNKIKDLISAAWEAGKSEVISPNSYRDLNGEKYATKIIQKEFGWPKYLVQMIVGAIAILLRFQPERKTRLKEKPKRSLANG